MRTYQSTEIGNVVVLGHAGCGKTSVIEAMLYRAGGSNRIGKIADGTTTSDYDAEEMKRWSDEYKASLEQGTKQKARNNTEIAAGFLFLTNTI